MLFLLLHVLNPEVIFVSASQCLKTYVLKGRLPSQVYFIFILIVNRKKTDSTEIAFNEILQPKCTLVKDTYKK